MLKKLKIATLWIICTVIFAGGLIELTNRFLLRERFSIGGDERTLAYRYDARLGWKPIPNVAVQFHSQNRSFAIVHNSAGFRDKEHGKKTRPRVAFIGDSFVWGYDVEQHERFTDLIQKKLPEWEILNFGVSGYGLDQTFLMIQEIYDDYQPDLVFLLQSYNDREDNSNNFRYGAYYKPLFLMHGNNTLELIGTPVAQSIRHYAMEYPILFSSYLVRGFALAYDAKFREKIRVKDPTELIVLAIKGFLDQKGARLLVGFQKNDEKLEAHCELHQIPTVRLRNPHQYPGFGSHWTPKGHALVADRILKTFEAYFITDSLLITPEQP